LSDPALASPPFASTALSAPAFSALALSRLPVSLLPLASLALDSPPLESPPWAWDCLGPSVEGPEPAPSPPFLPASPPDAWAGAADPELEPLPPLLPPPLGLPVLEAPAELAPAAGAGAGPGGGAAATEGAAAVVKELPSDTLTLTPGADTDLSPALLANVSAEPRGSASRFGGAAEGGADFASDAPGAAPEREGAPPVPPAGAAAESDFGGGAGAGAAAGGGAGAAAGGGADGDVVSGITVRVV
jgi:hypothetical protein